MKHRIQLKWIFTSQTYYIKFWDLHNKSKANLLSIYANIATYFPSLSNNSTTFILANMQKPRDHHSPFLDPCNQDGNNDLRQGLIYDGGKQSLVSFSLSFFPTMPTAVCLSVYLSPTAMACCIQKNKNPPAPLKTGYSMAYLIPRV